MRTVHAGVFGLRVRTALALPGLADDAGPDREDDLVVALVEPEAIDAAFGGAAEQAAGRLGDGRRWLVERGRAGDRRMTADGLARFHLDPGARCLLCAPLAAADAAFQRVLLDSALSTVAFARGAIALHAAVVALDGSALAIVAAAGSGKTTLACELLRRGAELLCDDVAVLDDSTGDVRVLPGPGVASVAAGRAGTLGRVIATLGDEDWIAVERRAAAALPLTAVVLLAREGDAPGAPEVGTPADALRAVLSHALPVNARGAHELARIAAVTAVVERARMASLRAAPPAPASDLADALERWLRD